MTSWHSTFSSYKWHLAFGAVFLIFAFFRFWNITYRTPFAWDHEQYATQVYDLLVNHHPTLLGPRITDAKGFFLAPYFTYLMVPFFIITRLHPSALTLFLIVLNCIFFVTTAHIISILFSRKHAVLFLLFWSLNPLLVSYDTNPWWPVLIPTGTILTWYVLHQIVNNNKLIWWIALGITLGFFANMHVQFIFIGIYASVFLLFSFRLKIYREIIKMISGLISFLLMYTPLLLFDLRHNMLNWKLLNAYWSDHVTDNMPYTKEWTIVLSHFLQGIIPGITATAVYFFIAAMIIISIWNTHKARKEERWTHLTFMSLFIFTAFGFSVYGSRPSEYYFTFLYPFILVACIELAINTRKEITLLVMLGIVTFLNRSWLAGTIRENEGGLYYRDQAIQKLLPYTKNKKVNVSFDMPLGMDNGYHYFLRYYDIMTTGNPKDPLIQLRIPPHRGDIRTTGLGIHIPDELK